MFAKFKPVKEVLDVEKIQAEQLPSHTYLLTVSGETINVKGHGSEKDIAGCIMALFNEMTPDGRLTIVGDLLSNMITD